MKRSEDAMLATLIFHIDLITDVLESLDPVDLVLRPIPSAGSFGKQFRHILDIRKCYRDALVTGTLDFYRNDIDHSIEENKELLIQETKKIKTSIEKSVQSINDIKIQKQFIDCGPSLRYLGDNYRTISPLQALGLLTEHEIFHEGEISLYLKAGNLRFPESWMVWGFR